MVFQSNVPGHEGSCRAVWLNRNQVCNRLDDGVTGFFKLIDESSFRGLFLRGPEFHGKVEYNSDIVETTALAG